MTTRGASPRTRRLPLLAAALVLVACAKQPVPERLSNTPGMVVDAAADGAHVYFVAWRNPVLTIARQPLEGGDLETLGEDPDAALHFAMTAETLYWITEAHRLKSLPKRGGKISLVAEGVDGLVGDDDALYAFELKPSGIHRLVAFAAADGAKRVVSEETNGLFLALDADAVYASGSKEVVRVAKAGGARSVLARTEVGGPLVLVADDVYYCDLALFRVPKRGGSPEKVNASCGDRLARQGGVVYASFESSSSGFGGHRLGSVFALPDGRSKRTLFEGAGARGLVAAGGALYFAGWTDETARPAWMRLRP